MDQAHNHGPHLFSDRYQGRILLDYVVCLVHVTNSCIILHYENLTDVTSLVAVADGKTQGFRPGLG